MRSESIRLNGNKMARTVGGATPPCAGWCGRPSSGLIKSICIAVIAIIAYVIVSGYDLASAMVVEDIIGDSYDELQEGAWETAAPDDGSAISVGDTLGGALTGTFDEIADGTDGPVTIVVTAGGDTTLGCTQRQSEMKTGFTSVVDERGYSWPLSGLAQIFSADDMSLVNFEGTLTESNDTQQKLYNFRGPAEYVNILTAGSIETVNLANNHFHDYGEQGKRDTKDTLDAAGITYCGAGITAIYETRGVKIGLIGNTFPYAKGKCDIRKDVAALRADGCQIIIASFHWGSEYETAFSAEQRSIGHAAIDAGADVVIGHHPHIVQGIELYKGKYILYSLGNLMFGGNTDPDDKDSYLARMTFVVDGNKTELPVFEMIPIRLTALTKGTDYHPVMAEGAEAERIRDRVLKRSRGVDSIDIAMNN